MIIINDDDDSDGEQSDRLLLRDVEIASVPLDSAIEPPSLDATLARPLESLLQPGHEPATAVRAETAVPLPDPATIMSVLQGDPIGGGGAVTSWDAFFAYQRATRSQAAYVSFSHE